ncbi:hypothetical protein [Congregibacter litoralis]|uniref:AlgX/AlgJ SGNH hydrolase-like domain-containing protein n=1 Tax=Congregibacter litoralis KT71 TaxID=314285 RepID=A4AA38_9GAMM|nr:hypothetical protein [Congregibacter litoralis]EAQ97355.1 hypothetical protein KT71_08244 [Congregibacter litoralis KT71]
MSEEQETAVAGFGARARLAIAAVALVFLLPSLGGFFADHQARQNWEKRELADFPDVKGAESAKAFFTGLEAFIDDHVGFAMSLNKFYRMLQFYLFKDSPIANVDIGDDGFVFFNAHSATRPYAALRKLCLPKMPQVRASETAMEGFAATVRRYGANTSYAIVPSKPLLYPDELPRTVPAPVRRACLSLDPLDSVGGQLRTRSAGKGYRVHFPIEALLALRDQPAFYPPGNFHSASMINHEFAGRLLRTLGIEPGDAYGQGASLGVISADMRSMGFTRRVEAWIYPYASYGVRVARGEPAWVKRFYSRARDFGQYRAANPASPRSALLLSNSFGAFVAPHLAPGFKTLTHINLNALQRQEADAFLKEVMMRVKPDEVIVLVHDGGIPNSALDMLAAAEQAGQ